MFVNLGPPTARVLDEKLKRVEQRAKDRVKYLDDELKYFTQYLEREDYVS